MRCEKLFLDAHVHTPYCHHAHGFLDEYIEVALQKGLDGVIFTCHNPMPPEFPQDVRMSMDNFSQYVASVIRQKQLFEGRGTVLLGLECDWLPGYEDVLKEQLHSYPFRFKIGSIHPSFPIYQHHFLTDDPIQSQIRYFQLLAQAAETGLFDCLAHPDLIKILYPQTWNPQKILPHIQPYLETIAYTGVAMEFNTSGIYKSIPEFFPGFSILELMATLKIPIFLASDAHQPWRVGDHFLIALELLLRSGFQTVMGWDQAENKIPIPISFLKEKMISNLQKSLFIVQ